MTKPKGNNKENFEKTRILFLQLAEQEFNTYGYAAASTARIVNSSGMARGSLYYHFKDKADLFRAVYINMLNGMAQDLDNKLNAINDPWDGFIAACREYFYLCASPQTNRIFLIEAQAILNDADRHDIIARTIRPILLQGLASLTKNGGFEGRKHEMLALFIFGTLSESGRILSGLPNRELAMEQYFETFVWAMKKMF